MLRDFLRQDGNVQVIVVVQLARVKSFRGKIVFQNSKSATKLLFNPDIEEAIVFRNSIVEHGAINVEPLTLVADNSREGYEADFMKHHPRKTVAELTNINEDGLFVVVAKVVDILNDGPWFYLSCKCKRSVTIQSGVYLCESCRIPILQVFPRYKVKVEVADETGSAVFILFDRDVNFLIQKTCEDLLTQHVEEIAEDGYPDLIKSLIGQRLLFKVESKLEQCFQFECTFPVRRVCIDEVLMSMFDLLGSANTPTKAVFAPPFPRVETEIVDLEEEPFSHGVSNVIGSVISLGDGCSNLPSNWTPAKRKLDGEFVASQVGCSVTGLKSNDGVGCSVGEVKSNEFVVVEDYKGSVSGLVSLKMEQE